MNPALFRTIVDLHVFVCTAHSSCCWGGIAGEYRSQWDAKAVAAVLARSEITQAGFSETLGCAIRR